MLICSRLLFTFSHQSIFQITPLNWREWVAVIQLSFPVIILDELLKSLSRVMSRASQTATTTASQSRGGTHACGSQTQCVCVHLHATVTRTNRVDRIACSAHTHKPLTLVIFPLSLCACPQQNQRKSDTKMRLGSIVTCSSPVSILVCITPRLLLAVVRQLMINYNSYQHDFPIFSCMHYYD